LAVDSQHPPWKPDRRRGEPGILSPVKFSPHDGRPMPTPEQVERYRRMTVGERFAETMRLNQELWDSMTPEERTRFLAAEAEEHRLSSEALCRGLAEHAGPIRRTTDDETGSRH
jgi:hypothetical protein